MNYDLERFIKAQQENYPQALAEIKAGKKASHWIWFIFPQHIALGYSSMSQKYGIRNMEEAKQYWKNPVLKRNLQTICTELLKHGTKNINEIMGDIDALKLKSCMTLFDTVAPDDIFAEVLRTFYNGEKDEKTIELLFS